MSFRSGILNSAAEQHKHETTSLSLYLSLNQRDGFTTADWLWCVEACVGRSPDDEALVFEGQSWSFKELDENANRVANS